MFRSALADLGLGPTDVVMVGDDIYNDIAGAQGAGIPGVLLRTGKYREDLVAEAGIIPDAILDSVADLRELV
jgi:ribonucleotide monophosphatase NagD (HAD superfamily)